MQAALQQGLLAAVADAHNQTEAQILAAAYMIPNPDEGLFEVPLFLEISDFAATAARIDHMLALRPAGIGYRLTGEHVAEAIGENAEHLQRFVRELGRRADSISVDNDYRPAVYLGLNGAFGKLAVDPVRHVGKVLGNCVGLQNAAGGRRLILEEPFILEDAIAQSSNLHRLKDTLHRRWNSENRGQPANLVGRGSQLSDHELTIYSDTRSVHGLVFDFSAAVDLDILMRRLAILYESGLDSYIYLDSTATHRWAITAADIAPAGCSAGLILSFDGGDERQFLACARHLAESVARHRIAR